jgi:hypothetical protein
MEAVIYENILPHNGPIFSCQKNDCSSFTESINGIKAYLKDEKKVEILDRSLAWFAMETERDFSELNGLNGYEIVEYINSIKTEKQQSR